MPNFTLLTMENASPQAMLEIGEVPRSLFVMSAMPKDPMAIPARKHISRLMEYGMNHDSFRVFCPM